MFGKWAERRDLQRCHRLVMQRVLLGCPQKGHGIVPSRTLVGNPASSPSRMGNSKSQSPLSLCQTRKIPLGSWSCFSCPSSGSSESPPRNSRHSHGEPWNTWGLGLFSPSVSQQHLLMLVVGSWVCQAFADDEFCGWFAAVRFSHREAPSTGPAGATGVPRKRREAAQGGIFCYFQ